MKTVKTLIMTVFCLSVAGCGLSDPWRDWEDAGTMPEDRLLPSEIKETLCSAEGWRLTYDNRDFYFQFSEDGNVVCNSDFFQNAVTTSYHLDWDTPEEVYVVITGGGHFSYLDDNVFGETLVITSFGDNEMTCRYENGTEEYTMTAVSDADIQTMNDTKWSVRTILASADWWTFTYDGYDFYYKFSEDGTVECNSNIPQQASSTTYSFSGTVEDMVLTISGGGHISYLPEEYHVESFNVVSSSSSEIQLTTVPSGISLVFTPVSDTDVEAVEVQKGAALVENAFVQNGFSHGVVRNADGGFLAHFTVDYTADGITTTLEQFNFNVLYNRVLSHKTVSVSSVEADGTITFSEPVSVNGTDVSSIVYNTSDNTVTAGEMNITANTGMADWIVSDFKTYVLRPSALENRGDMEQTMMDIFNEHSDTWDKLELSDRSNRPFIYTPKNGNLGGRTWTCFYAANSDPLDGIKTDEPDRIRFDRPYSRVVDINGGAIPENFQAEIAEFYPVIMDAFYHADGLYVILEGERNADNSQLYLISPTTDKWFKMDRDI